MRTFTLALILALAAPLTFAGDANAQHGHKNHVPMTFAELPAAVQKTVTAHHGEQSTDIYKVTKKTGTVIYVVGVTGKKGKEHKLHIAEDGTLIQHEKHHAAAASAPSAPAAPTAPAK